MASKDSIPQNAEGTGESKTLTAQCHCKSVHFTVTVPISSLPITTHLCHCFVCRQVHGSFCCFHAPLHNGIQPIFVPPSSLSTSVTRYRHPEAASDRIFCTTCGCHIGDEDLTPDPSTGVPEWRIATSIITPQGPDIFHIRTHFFTDSQPGPGLHTFLPQIDSRDIRTWTPDPGHPVFPMARPSTPAQEFDEGGNEVLRAECHCGGVSFSLPRPYHPSLAGNPLLKRLASPVNGSKWLACVDVCDDCRLVTGTHVVGWTFVPLGSLRPRIGEDLSHGTLKVYRSSEGVKRAFCGGCGATVFYLNDDKERIEGGDRIVDVAVGILRAPEGVLAEKWLTWRTGRVAFHKSGLEYDRGFTEALGKGLREWGIGQDGEAFEFEIPLA